MQERIPTYSLWVKREQEKKYLRRACTITAGFTVGRLLLSTVRQSRRICLRASFSDMTKELSRVRKPAEKPDFLKLPTTAPSFLTKLVNCRLCCNRGFKSDSGKRGYK